MKIIKTKLAQKEPLKDIWWQYTIEVNGKRIKDTIIGYSTIDVRYKIRQKYPNGRIISLKQVS